MSDRALVHHATALLLGGRAVLLRGASGSGKSHIALGLLGAARRAGAYAALIGDDQVALEVVAGRLIARAVAPLAGRVEVRGLGIVTMDHEAAGVVGLVVDLVRECPDRMPDRDAGDLTIDIGGIVLPRLPLWMEDPAPLTRVGVALAALAGIDVLLGQNPPRCEFET